MDDVDKSTGVGATGMSGRVGEDSHRGAVLDIVIPVGLADLAGSSNRLSCFDLYLTRRGQDRYII